MNGLGQVFNMGQSVTDAQAAVGNEIKLREYQKGVQQEQALKQLMGGYAAGQMTPEEVTRQAMAVDPETGIKLQSHFATLSKERRVALKAQREELSSVMDRIATAGKEITTQEELDAFRASMAELGRGVTGFDINNIPANYETWEAVKGGLGVEAKYTSTFMKDIAAHEEIVSKYGADSPVAKESANRLTKTTREFQAKERDFQVDLLKTFSPETVATALNTGKYSGLQPRDKLSKGGVLRRKDGTYDTVTFNTATGQYALLDGTPITAADGVVMTRPQSDDDEKAPTVITTKQLDAARRIVEGDEAFKDVENLDEMIDAVVTRSNMIAQNSKDDYGTILRTVVKNIKSGELQEDGAKHWYGDKDKFSPATNVTEEEIKAKGLTIYENDAGEKGYVDGEGKWQLIK